MSNRTIEELEGFEERNRGDLMEEFINGDDDVLTMYWEFIHKRFIDRCPPDMDVTDNKPHE